MAQTIHEKYMDALAYMNKTVKADIASGKQWKYCNKSSHKGRNFEDARKKKKYLINCVDGVQWACIIAGIPTNALSWYGSGGIVWLNSKAKERAKKYFKIINANGKTVKQLRDGGLLCEGDILTYVNYSHTNAYYKDGKSFDSGHAFCTNNGEHAPFKKLIGSLQYSSQKVAYILRIKDRKHYRAQAGAYANLDKANERVKELLEKWKIKSEIKSEDGLYKIQVGYYDGKENCEKAVANLKKKTKDNNFIVKELG